MMAEVHSSSKNACFLLLSFLVRLKEMSFYGTFISLFFEKYTLNIPLCYKGIISLISELKFHPYNSSLNHILDRGSSYVASIDLSKTDESFSRYSTFIVSGGRREIVLSKGSWDLELSSTSQDLLVVSCLTER